MDTETAKVLYEVVNVLSDDDRLTAYDMFFDYYFDGYIPDFEDEKFGSNKAIWNALFIFWKNYVKALSKKE